MHATAESGDLFVGIAQDRVVFASVPLDMRTLGKRRGRRLLGGIGSLRVSSPSALSAASSLSTTSSPSAGCLVRLRRWCKHTYRQPPRLPGLYVAQLFGEAARIRGNLIRLFTHDGGRLMLPVAIARGAGKAEDDHVGTVFPDDPYHVREEAFAAPFFQGFRSRFGESEVDGAGEELLGAVEPTRGQQLLGANDSKLRALLGADQVLAPLAAG